MSRHRNITTATHQPRHDQHQETPLAPDVQAWVRSLVNQSGISEKYLIDSCNKLYGAGGVAVAKMEAEKAQQLINQGHGDPNVAPIFKLVVIEPSPNEKVIVVKLSDNDSIRIWGNVFNDPHVFAFDFINSQGEHIRTPPDVKIYSDGLSPSGEVLSMEHLCQWPGPTSSNTWPCDPNEETYLIAEGSKIRIVRPGHPDCHLTIPSRRPRHGRYVAMPEYW